MNKRRNTALFALLIAAAALAGLAWRGFGRTEAVCAVVRVRGEEAARLPLSADTELLLGDEAGGYNRIRVEDGAVFVAEADCPDQICVREGKKHRGGDTIACLPHELIIVLEGADSGTDAVAW